MAAIEFFVPGLPVTQGSTRALIPRGHTRPVVIHDAGPQLRTWRTAVSMLARQHCAHVMDGPLALTIGFTLPRPRAAGGLAPSRPG